MRTVVDIDDAVLAKAMKMTGIKKKVEIVNYALSELVSQREIEEILSLAGAVKWEGDLEEMRSDRHGVG